MISMHAEGVARPGQYQDVRALHGSNNGGQKWRERQPRSPGCAPARWRGPQPLGHSQQRRSEGAGVLAAARSMQKRRCTARLVPLDEQLHGGRVAPPDQGV